MFELKIDIRSYWLAGTGRGSGGSYDEKPLVDENGIPYIPGKHLKGLLKEGLRSWALKTNKENSDIHIQCFGTDNDGENIDKNIEKKTKSGVLRVSSATFDQETYNNLIDNNNKKRIARLFKELSSTEINEKGVAKNKSLRTLQVVIPVTLYAQLDWVSTSPYANDDIKENVKAYLEQAIAMLPAIGSKRTRGLGRCQISVTENSNGVDGADNGGENNA